MATRVKNPPGSPDYRHDGYGWAMAQAALIRAGRLSEVDWENVAEEIESVGKSERRALESALQVVIVHILKWDFQPSRRTRSWANSIAAHRAHFEDLLSENPSLKPQLDDILRRAWRLARVDAEQETGLDADLFPIDPYGWDRLRSDPFTVSEN